MPTNRGLSKTGLIRALAARLDISLKESGALRLPACPVG